jgi:hypothetical protein
MKEMTSSLSGDNFLLVLYRKVELEDLFQFLDGFLEPDTQHFIDRLSRIGRTFLRSTPSAVQKEGTMETGIKISTA